MQREESLNIDYHTKRLILKSLNKHRTVREARKACGISEKTIYRKMKQYSIKKIDDEYCEVKKVKA